MQRHKNIMNSCNFNICELDRILNGASNNVNTAQMFAHPADLVCSNQSVKSEHLGISCVRLMRVRFKFKICIHDFWPSNSISGYL